MILCFTLQIHKYVCIFNETYLFVHLNTQYLILYFVFIDTQTFSVLAKVNNDKKFFT